MARVVVPRTAKSEEYRARPQNSETHKEQAERIAFLVQELNVLCDMLKFAGDVSRKEVLPPLERKKTSFVPNLEQFDPTLGRKKGEQQ